MGELKQLSDVRRMFVTATEEDATAKLELFECKCHKILKGTSSLCGSHQCAKRRNLHVY